MNEGLLGKMFGFLGKKLKAFSSKIKASKNIDPLFESAISDIEGFFNDKNMLLKFKESQSSQSQSQGQDEDDKTKETGNVLDEAIGEKLSLLKKKVEKFTKDDEGKEIYQSKMYAQLKFVEIQELIIKKKIEYLKAENIGYEEFEEKTKKLQKQIKEDSQALEKFISKNKKSDTGYKVGDIINYTTDDNIEVKIKITNTDNGISGERISSKDDKDELADEKGKEFQLNTKNNIVKIGEDYIEKVKEKFKKYL
jgi:hypothetical protein